MKSAVILLLFLAAVAECRFMTGETWPKSHYQTYRSPRLGKCAPLISNKRLYLVCAVMNNLPLSCDKLRSFFNSSVPEFSAASEYLYGANSCDRPEEKVPQGERPMCGQSRLLEQTEAGSGGGGGGRWGGRGRIVGGQVTRNCSVIPWQVQVKAFSNLCGGSLISDRHVLTAAHCVDELVHYSSLVRVVVGVHDRTKPGTWSQKMDVARIDVHEDYSQRTFENDIAILHLQQPLNFTSNKCVAPVCLSKHFQPEGQNCTVSGWGATRFRGPTSNVLKMAQVKTHLGRDCKEAFGIRAHDYLASATSQICAGFSNGGIDSCQGDSGGPLVCWHKGSYVQAGVVSNGKGCAWSHLPGLYTNVAHFLDWIEEKTGINSTLPE